MTRSKVSVAVFARAYNLVRSMGILQLSWFRKAFISSYFLYKRLYEDPYWFLIRHRPELFLKGDILDIGANIGYTHACLRVRPVLLQKSTLRAGPGELQHAGGGDSAKALAGNYRAPPHCGWKRGRLGAALAQQGAFRGPRVVTPKFKESGVPGEEVASVTRDHGRRIRCVCAG